MLRRCTNLRFARNSSPERERREILFAAKPTDPNEEAEGIEQGAGGATPDSAQSIKSISGSAREEFLEIAPLEFSKELSELEEKSNELFQLAEEEIPEVISRISLEFSSHDKRIILERILRDPGTTLELQRMLERQLERKTSTEQTAEARKKLLLRIVGPGERMQLRDGDFAKDDVELVALMEMDNPPLDRGAIGSFLKLDEKIRDPAVRERRLDYIFGALNEIDKTHRLGLSRRPLVVGRTSPEEEREWRNRYYSGLDQQNEMLQTLLLKQLQRKATRLLERNRATADSVLGGSLKDLTFTLKNDEALATYGASRQAMLERFLALELKALEILGATDEGARARHRAIMSRLLKKGDDVSQNPFLQSLTEEMKRAGKLKPGKPHELENSLTDYVGRKNRVLDELSRNIEAVERRRAAGETDLFLEERMEQERAEKWAKETAQRAWQIFSEHRTPPSMLLKIMGNDGTEVLSKLLEILKPYREGDPVTLRQNAVERILALELRDEEMRHISDFLTVLEQSDVLRGLSDDEELPPLPEGEIGKICADTRERLDAVMNDLLWGDSLSPILDHSVCRNLGIARALQEHRGRFEGLIRQAEIDEKHDRSGKDGLREALQEIGRLEKCRDELKNWKTEKVVWESNLAVKGGHDRKGSYRPVDGKIHLDASLQQNQAAMEYTLEHERGHLILDVLTRTSKVFPLLLGDAHRTLQSHADPASGKPYAELLESLSDYWGLTPVEELARYLLEQKNMPPDQAMKHAREIHEHDLTDELLVSYTSWDGKIDPQASELRRKEYALFTMLRDLYAEKMPTVHTPRKDLEIDPGLLAMREKYQTTPDNPLGFHNATVSGWGPGGGGRPPTTGGGGEHHEEEEEHDRERGTAAVSESSSESETLKEDLQQIEKNIFQIEQFQIAFGHVNVLGTPGEVAHKLAKIKKAHAKLWKKLLEKDPERDPDPAMIEEVKQLREHLKKKMETIHEFDIQQLDTTGVAREAPGFFDRVKFMSLLDVKKLWTDTMEDIHHIYKRRQDRVLDHVGRVVTGVLRKGENLPWLGEYLQELNQYHERRYSGEEQKAANEWKEGLVNEDSHSVLEMIPGSHNKDQIRGIITLLCERGEMNWNDEGVWDTLAHLSGYHHEFPKEACRRSDVLRDTWLRKMIAVIWKDKELYYEWLQSNDGKFDSGKKSFEPKVDQLSNVRGGMASELEKQLKIYSVWKDDRKKGIRRPLPEDVKMHLYEETITYAIEKGKMSMEQKFYYLVQGVASGLLSIDRLRVIAGKYLNLFPFIDYFYGRNNTLPEIQKIADRIQEREPKKKYKPGIRTTLWLHYEVAREKGAQERLSKALSGARAENIDHEDIPFFITNADVSSVDNMTGAISGTRLKMSPEGTKNAYVGWGSKFKAFGGLMAAEQEHLERVTSRDVEMLAQTLIGYIHYDNIVTRNVSDLHKPTERAILTENQFNTVPPSSAGATTMQFRKGMTSLLRELVRKLGPVIQANMDQKQELRQLNARVTDFIATDPSELRRANNSMSRSQELYKVSTYFYDALLKAIRAPDGRDIFKQVLREQGDTIPNEVGSSDLTIAEAVRLIREAKGSDGESSHDPAAPAAAAHH